MLGAGRIEKDGTGAARQPNVPEEKGPAPGHEGSPTASPEATSRPETIHPEDGRPSPKAQPSAAVPARPEEPPGPTATVPPPEPDASRSPGRPSGDGATGDGPSTSASGPSASSTADLAATGWVRITNKGRLPADLRDDPGGSGHRGPGLEPDRRGRDEAGLGHESGSIATPSTGEKDRATAESVGLGTTATNLRPAEGSRADLGSMRVRPKLHIVERGENFWSISQLYYGDGRRYYRALWKANSRKYPNIREIHINDVIEIPAVEDLDPAYIVSPPSRPVASRPDGSEEASPSGPERPSSFPTTRAARLSVTADDALARRSDPELELPIAEPEPAPARGGRFPLADRSGTGEGRTPLPSSRSTARPLDGDQGERPVYKVRPYDTLRSIARDFLGDPRRADEIYEINRDVIADPTRLTAGLLLELPEDADTRRVTIRERYRGRD